MDVLLVKMMPPSCRAVFALVGLLTLLKTESSLLLNNCNCVLQQTFVHLHIAELKASE